ncbi:MAG: hypothetical protein ACXAEU_15290, partial [Candidatus Hodarchaeales archaeon]
MNLSKKAWQIGIDKYIHGSESSHSFFYILTMKSLCAFGGLGPFPDISLNTRGNPVWTRLIRGKKLSADLLLEELEKMYSSNGKYRPTGNHSALVKCFIFPQLTPETTIQEIGEVFSNILRSRGPIPLKSSNKLMTAVKELRKWKIDEITNLQGKSCLALIKEL